jgi:hypothetical protein
MVELKDCHFGGLDYQNDLKLNGRRLGGWEKKGAEWRIVGLEDRGFLRI